MTRFRAEQWSKETPLGSACRYVETYFKELTLYLDEPYLDPTNNLQERLLRAEKKIQDNAYFRKTLRGRFAVDVNRSILQTATAAGININAYLNHIYRVPSAKILANPEKYTPMAYGDELC